MSLKKLSLDILKYIVGHKEYVSAPKNGILVYPIDLSFTLKKEKSFYFPKDSFGIPQKKFNSVGVQYNPTRIAAYGLANWNEYEKSNDKVYKDNFIKALNWFYENEVEGKWHYTFNWNNIKAPWISCMAQGEGISILVRGYALTGDVKYLDLAFKAITPFEVPIENKGVLSFLGKNCIFFEEYPEAKPKHVLNGFLYSLIGLLELNEITKNTKYRNDRLQALIKEAIISLEKNINRWDTEFWSCYDLHNENERYRNMSTMSYHTLHTTQLLYVSECTNSDILSKYAIKWSKYIVSPINRGKAMLLKILYRIKYPAQR